MVAEAASDIVESALPQHDEYTHLILEQSLIRFCERMIREQVKNHGQDSFDKLILLNN